MGNKLSIIKLKCKRSSAASSSNVEQQLQSELRITRRQLNATHSPIYRLPLEILALIFEHACPPPSICVFPSDMDTGGKDKNDVDVEDDTDSDIGMDDDMSLAVSGKVPYSQFVLGAVSVHWREVLLSYPYLWTSVRLKVKNSTRARCIALLMLFLERSRGLPFALSLSFDLNFHFAPSVSSSLLDPIVDRLIFEAIPRICRLELHSPPKQWLQYIPLMSRLTDCTVRPYASHQEELRLTGNFNLQRASFRHARASIELPWSNITILELKHISIDICVHLLFQCINLHAYHIDSYESRNPPRYWVFPYRRTTFQRLTTFVCKCNWTFALEDDGRWTHAMLQYIHLPALKSLHWGTPGFVDWTPDTHARNFFSGLPRTLSNAEFSNIFVSSGYDFVIETLSCEMQVERLLLSNFEDVILSDVLRRLDLRSSTDDGRGDVPFPKLRTLVLGPCRLGNYASLPQLSAEYSQDVLAMLVQRFGLTSQKAFRLELRSLSLDWSPAVKKTLQEMVRGGFDLEIVESGSPVPWLLERV